MAIPKTLYTKAVQDYAGQNGQGELIIQSMITLDSLSFAAFLTGFTQSFKSNWNQESVYGRNDPIATFQGTIRSFSLAFDIPSGNLEQAKAALDQCDDLMKFLYPAYNDVKLQPLSQAKQKGAKKGPKSVGRILSHAPLVKVRFANLMRAIKPAKSAKDSDGLLGYLDGLEWSPVMDMGYFLDGKGNIFPKVISLSFGFNVLHQVDLGWKSEKPTETLYKDHSFFSPEKTTESKSKPKPETPVVPKTPKP